MEKQIESRIEKIVRASDRSYEYMSSDWRDGLLQGNGSLAAISYVPGGMEWVINKNDVFDRRTYKPKTVTPHKEMMKLVEDSEDKETFFIDTLEKRSDGYTLRSVTPCILKLFCGNGELGWGAPAFPKIGGSLSLYDGELKLSLDAHFVHSRVKSVIPRNRSVFALRMEGCAVIDWDHKIEIYRPYNDEMELPEWFSDCDGEIAFVQELPEGIGRYAVALKAVTRKPDISRVSYELPHDFDFSALKEYVSPMKRQKLSASLTNKGDVDVFVSVFSDYDTENPLEAAISEVREAASLGYEALEAETREFWHSFWSGSVADFGKYKDIQDYWVFSMYELASSYGKAPMPALSGMLYGPLSPTSPGVTAHNYTSDQNIQIPLLPASIVNHPELVVPLVETFMRNEGAMKEYTKQIFGGEGIFIPLVSNQNGKELVSGCYRYTMCGSAYVGIVLARTWEYTRDDRLMREKLYPFLEELIRFYVSNMLHLGDDGKYHLDYTVPPEIFKFTKDETATISMLRAYIRTALKWCGIEGINNKETELWQDVLDRFPTLAKRASGSWWGGPDIPEEHFSFGTHILYPFFPSEDYQTEEDREAALATLDYIARDAVERCHAGPSDWHFIHDWSWHLYYSAKAHLGHREEVWEQLFTFLDYFAKPNGLFTHNSIIVKPSSVTEENHRLTKRADDVCADFTNGPSWYGSGKCASPNIYSKNLTAPVIEGNSIFLLRATETLIQSFDGIVRLFPGVPNDFDGEFYNLRAKGGFYVSGKMENGRLTYAEIRAKVDSTLKLELKDDYAISKQGSLTHEFGIDVFNVRLSAGEVLKVTRKND